MSSTPDHLSLLLEKLIEAKVEAAVARALAITTPNEVSSVRLPADAKNVEAFNLACRSGRVDGARKRGRIWVCTLEAWNNRTPAERPRIKQQRSASEAKAPSRVRHAAVTRDVDVLRELGLAAPKRCG